MAERESLKRANPLSGEIKGLIRGANFAHLATLMRDGWPHVDPVWMDLEDRPAERVVLVIAVERARYVELPFVHTPPQ